jgi:hypothetical protein
MIGMGWAFRLMVVGLFTAMIGCAGGGADVGNPRTGIVSYRSNGSKADGAMVILAKRGADPGYDGEQSCVDDGNIGVCSTPIHFDTTYTDDRGNFRFDTVYPGAYVIVASQNGLLALAEIEERAFQEGETVSLTLDTPATIFVKPYEAGDTAGIHFRGVRVAGTGFMDSADEGGEMALRSVPAGKLDLILYRSDTTNMIFPSFRTDAGRTAELYFDPSMPVSYWTPHPSGERDPLGRPYILDTYIPSVHADSLVFPSPTQQFDLRIRFSHPMDAVSIAGALSVFSDDTATTIQSLWWEGGNVLYVSLCVADSLGSCRTSESQFEKGVTYGVTIDTTAETSFGVPFAHEATIRFIPEP